MIWNFKHVRSCTKNLMLIPRVRGWIHSKMKILASWHLTCCHTACSLSAMTAVPLERRDCWTKVDHSAETSHKLNSHRKMNVFLLFAIVLFGILFDASAFIAKPLLSSRIITPSKIIEVSYSLASSCINKLAQYNSNMALSHSKDGETKGEPYLQHICPSCSYVYDEEKGFKKRHPPGK